LETGGPTQLEEFMIGFETTLRPVKFMLQGVLATLLEVKFPKYLPIRTTGRGSRDVVILNAPIGVIMDVFDMESISFDKVREDVGIGKKASNWGVETG
jgi:hypothetical protein